MRRAYGRLPARHRRLRRRSASRRKILARKLALVAPGHGDPFLLDENTPT
ncbi:hypothetical protein ACH4HG_29825 [Streptomyces coeruleorubidus]|nr:hypothetical protein [Streptomyces bellus]